MPEALFTPDQTRSILVRLEYLDHLLLEIDRLTRETDSPFAAKRPDLSNDEVALLQTYIARVRTGLMTALETLEIARPQPDGSARWSIQTALTFAGLTVQEITPASMRGYGPMSDAGAERLTTVADRLRRLFQDGIALLHEHDPGGVADQLAQLPGTPGEVLRALDEMSVASHLDTLRPLIAAAADRAEDTLFTLGVFGRVSVGKSSLINALIGSSVLPVGVTPVTAVPIRVQHGAPSATVDFFSGARLAIAPETLATYVTEQHNPNNERGIQSVTLTVPSVPDGLRILDTPGVGSLSAMGPAQTFAWLPRCDLGLVLVAPGTPVGRDELALVAGLVNAGIPCHVLLSKADTLADDDLAAALQYVQRQLQRGVAPASALSLTAVSVHPEHAEGLQTLHRDVVAPLARAHVARMRLALASRLRTLIETARREMAREDVSRDASRDTTPDIAPDTTDTTPGAHARAANVSRITDAFSAAAPTLLAQAADRVAEAWARGEDGQAAARSAIVTAAGAALARVRDAAGMTAGPDQRRLPPLFDPEWLDALPALTPPPFAPGPLRHTLAARRLAPLRRALATDVARYAARLDAWGKARIEGQTAAQADIVPPTPSASSSSSVSSLSPSRTLPEATDARLTHLLDLVDRMAADPATP